MSFTFAFPGKDRINSMEFAKAPKDMSEIGIHTTRDSGKGYHISTRWETADNQMIQPDDPTDPNTVFTGMISMIDYGPPSGDFFRNQTLENLSKITYEQKPRLRSLKKINTMLASAHARYVNSPSFRGGKTLAASSARVSILKALLFEEPQYMAVDPNPDWYLYDLSWIVERFTFAGIVTSSKTSSREIPFRSTGEFRTMKYVENMKRGESLILCLERADATSPFQFVPRLSYQAPLLDIFDPENVHPVPRITIGMIREVESPKALGSRNNTFAHLHTPTGKDELSTTTSVNLKISVDKHRHHY